MQAITVAVPQQVEPLGKINAGALRKKSGSHSDETKQTSFAERVDQSEKEQTASRTKDDAGKVNKAKSAVHTEKSAEKRSVQEKASAVEKTQNGKNPVEKNINKKTAESQYTEQTVGKNTLTKKDAVKLKKSTAKNVDKEQKDDYSKELAYLQGTVQKNTDQFDAIIEQAEEYKNTDTEKSKIGLAKAQRLSVEAPEQFLEEQAAAVQKNKTKSSEKMPSSLKGKEDKLSQKKKFALDKDGKIIVTDLRTDTIDDKTAENSKDTHVKNAQTVKTDGNNSVQMTMNFSDQVQQNILSSSNQSASASSSNFQAMLTNQVQQNAQEFVKAGSIVLKDNNIGTIKLVLHPESLGNVKINLQLSDKVISGQITVASQDAYNAFKDSADSLKQAFIQSGFETSGFTVAYSGANAGGSSFSGSQNQENNYTPAHASGSYDNAQFADAIPAVGGSYITASHALNIVA
jgi:flagellar hook-length control protein FliK